MYLQESKKCTRCNEYLSLSSFEIYNHKGTSKYRSRCKPCRLLDKKEYRSNNTGTLNYWLKEVLYSTRSRARERNLEHNLTKEWLLSNLPKTCPVLGVELSFISSHNNKPSLDRFDNNKGYTTDNVRIISFRANALKSNATLEELEAIVRYMKNEQ